MSQESPFEFKVDLAVVESLGMNLYSNAAAVLSELVANAWDADANTVRVNWVDASESIVIEDDGRGMSLQQLNDRYLTVAYKKRENEGHESPRHHRPFMGRKGIGKLSVFSLAREIVVLSADGTERNGLKIDVDALRKHIDTKTVYKPKRVPVPDDLPAEGTRIVLRGLNRKRTGVSVTALRRRLARRFDVLRFADDAEDRFDIFIDGKKVTYADREDLKRLEYLWQLGDDELSPGTTPKVKRRWLFEDSSVAGNPLWKLEGWFGTVRTPDELNDEEDDQESLRNILILARRRPIQEGILDQLDFNKLFASYVTGQIRAEFLDLDDGSDDIATSDRQRLIEDDQRVKGLLEKLREMFNTAAQQWSDERPKQKFIELTAKHPIVKEWVDRRPESQRDSARKVISAVAGLHLEDEAERVPLYKASILAFERIALEKSAKELAQFADGLFAVDLLPLLATARSYEDALYIQILRSRLEAIEKLEGMINKDELEKVLQKHLFDNMWLLDPSWEGATGDADMEIALSRIRRGQLFSKSEVDNQKQGRIDIQYRSAAGVHMIVELKKYRRKVSLDDLRIQGEKYHEALSEVLRKQNEPVREVSVVFVLGEEPRVPYSGEQRPEEHVARQLQHISGRVLYYDELLATAQKRYKDYRDQKADVTELDQVLRALEDGADDSEP
ncbi:BbrUII/HgiDII family restriction enzyme [Aquipuribacter sp. MA13-6]|uniref:BbrUII/HgiDII family restriction enzyme n=1 Tax=unclassified Aquipuribacter TaxID=2635084 RepID=UPI003EF08495